MAEAEDPQAPPQPSTELTLWQNRTLEEIARLGKWLAYAESDDKSQTALGATAALRLFYALTLGLPPTGANDLNVIHGRLHIGAQTYRTLARRAGYRVVKAQVSAESCTAVLFGPDGAKIAEEIFTIEQAKKAGWIRDGSGWVKTPDRMLWARASSNVIRDYAPEVGLGLGILEEVGDYIEGEAVELPEEGPEPESEPPNEG